ncbi:MAG: CHAT domain-containing protein [Desulfobacterales bacterium]|nr:CHAT domain-containing protein [Desulfobacterales bacterium]
MKTTLILSVCFICVFTAATPFLNAEEKNLQKYEKEWEHLNAQVIKALNEGRYQEGIPIGEKAYQFAFKHLGEEHPSTLISINNLALCYHYQGGYRESESLYKKALQLSEKVLGKEHSDTIISINNLAGLYVSQGRYAEAEPLYKKALQLHEKVFGKEHPSTFVSINSLAFLYHSQGRYGEAEPLYKKALQLRQKILGKEHPSTLISINNLARLYASEGRYGKAESLFKEALQLRKKVLGKEHPSTLISTNNLAALYFKQRRYEEAEPLFKETLQLSEKILGKEHPNTLGIINNLAVLYERQKRYIEAESLFKDALQIKENILGKEHPNTIQNINNLAFLYSKQGHYGKAEQLIEEALQLREKVLGKEHPDTVNSISTLAVLYKLHGRYGKAEMLYKEALQLREKILGKEHPDTLSTQLNYIIQLVNMNKPQSAFRSMKNMEYRLLSRSFQELYTTSADRIRRKFLKNISNFRDTVFSFALKYPESEYLEYAANVMLRWKGIYAEENAYQHRFLNISNDPEVKQMKEKLAMLRAEFSIQIHHPKPEKNIGTIWNDLLLTENAVREKAKKIKPDLLVSSADIEQVIAQLPRQSGLIEFRMFRLADLKIGKLGNLHWVVCLILPDIEAKQRVFFEDLGEVTKIPAKPDALYSYLFGKFDERIKNLKKLYIAPDGLLNQISFASLKLADGRYLVQRQQINQLQRGRDLLSSFPENTSDLLIAVGGIDYGKKPDVKLPDKNKKNADKPKHLNFRAVEELRAGIEPLENSIYESVEIAEYFKFYKGGKAIIIKGDKATEKKLKNLNTAPRILHLSTHGFYLETRQKEQWAEEQPLLLSGLALANANLGLQGITDEKGDDGLLYSIEVAGMNLQGTELVSLSACDTGKGVADYSEGVYGLVRAFRTAGAQNVLMTLTPVGDKSSRAFMTKFYETWLSSKGNIPPSDALHQTRLFFISHKNEDYRDPKIWSPYVLIGR